MGGKNIFPNGKFMPLAESHILKLVVYLLPWKIWVRQIGSSSQLLGKIKVMFQTTNQLWYTIYNGYIYIPIKSLFVAGQTTNQFLSHPGHQHGARANILAPEPFSPKLTDLRARKVPSVLGMGI